MTEQRPPKHTTKEQLHIARSMFLDGFANAERAVISLHGRIGSKNAKMQLSQRLEALGKVKAGPTFSKAKANTLAEALGRLATLNDVRNDVVHSRMSVAPVDGETRAIFINSNCCSNEFPVGRLVTFEQFNKLAKELAEIAKSLADLTLSPASSPPPPLPVAAADP